MPGGQEVASSNLASPTRKPRSEACGQSQSDCCRPMYAECMQERAVPLPVRWVAVGEPEVHRQRGKSGRSPGGYDPATGRRRIRQLGTFNRAERRSPTEGPARGPGPETETVGDFLERVWLPSKEGRVEVSTLDQYNLEAVAGHRLYTASHLSLLRRGAHLALRWSDVDVVRQQLSVTRQLAVDAVDPCSSSSRLSRATASSRLDMRESELCLRHSSAVGSTPTTSVV